MGGLHDQFDDPSRGGVKVQGLVNGAGVRFGAGGLADMEGAAIGALEGGGAPALAGQHLAEGAPACIQALLPQAAADQLDALVGQYGDKEMALDPLFLMVKDRAQTECRLEAAEHGFEVRQQGIGSPHGFGIPPGLITAQAVDTRMGEAAAGDGLPAKVEGGSLFALGVGHQFDGIVLARAPALFLQAAKAFVEFGEALFAPGFAQTVGEFLQARFEAFGKALGDSLFLFGASRRVAVQANFLAIRIRYPLQLQRVAPGGVDFQRGREIELSLPFTADDQVAIALCPEPGEVFFRRQTAIHDPQGARWRA